jgi:hypothetical protein
VIEGDPSLVHQGLRELESRRPHLDVLIPHPADDIHIELEAR